MRKDQEKIRKDQEKIRKDQEKIRKAKEKEAKYKERRFTELLKGKKKKTRRHRARNVQLMVTQEYIRG